MTIASGAARAPTTRVSWAEAVVCCPSVTVTEKGNDPAPTGEPERVPAVESCNPCGSPVALH